MSATDTGAGVASASISVPGVGDLAAGTVFALGETNLNETVASGTPVSLTGTATDRVGNANSQPLTVLYDYLTPTIDVLSLSDSTRLYDGRFVTTSPQVQLLVAFADEASGLTQYPPWVQGRLRGLPANLHVV